MLPLHDWRIKILGFLTDKISKGILWIQFLPEERRRSLVAGVMVGVSFLVFWMWLSFASLHLVDIRTSGGVVAFEEESGVESSQTLSPFGSVLESLKGLQQGFISEGEGGSQDESNAAPSALPSNPVSDVSDKDFEDVMRKLLGTP